MALRCAIRKAAFRIAAAPTVRSAAAFVQRHISYSQRSSSLSTAVGRPSGNLFRSSFPSLMNRYSTKTGSDQSLLRVLETEIQCAVESQGGEDEEVPPEFPFEIKDQPGQRTITLERTYLGETISVEVFMPDLITGEDDDDNRNASEDDDNAEGGERANQSSLPMVVRVAKTDGGPVLEFGCTAYPDEVAIDSLSVKAPDDDEEHAAYEGPDFADLDENLQKSFHKYLELRGIKPSTTNFLHGYMVDKDAKEYITWLKNIQKFVQA
ncbi:hypothetical protein M569_08553 [Genlisea aurea]|uniref:Mitochondrial glycoprotein family protein n=1 Tax=Genlisea aurea TaxID=192259 RepID=S8CH83_9LAMI|nr:hypothetical protein M569_08553 [Genlisea aurea]